MKQLPIRILGVAPYEGMQVAMKRAAESFPNVKIDVFTGDLDAGADIVRVCHQESYDCIISRGGTANMIRSVTNIPVIEVQLSSYDVMRTMKLAENYTKRYAIMGFPNITGPAHALCNLMKYKVDIVTIQSAQEIRPTLERLRSEGVEMIIGGMTPHRIAQEIGMNALLITSGVESLQSSIEHAVAIGTSFQQLRKERLFLTSIMRGESDNIAVLDEEGEPYYTALEELQQEMWDMLRQKIPEIPAHAPLRFYYSHYSKLYRIVAQVVRIGNDKYYLFHFTNAPNPIRSGKSGIRIYSKKECELFFKNSFFNLSGALGELKGKLDTIATINQPVIITGEVGTGKIQMAYYLYLRSQDNTKPFVLIDCAVASDKNWEFLLNRYDSPLNDSGNTICFQNFDAISQANGWALIEMILSTKMYIRERLIFCYSRPEGSQLSEVAIHLLRSLSCLPMTPLPMRKRTDEISSLANLYLKELNMEFGKQIMGFDSTALEQLRKFNWPGNYIQFKRVIRELAINTDSFYIQGADVAEILIRERNEITFPVAVQPGFEPGLTLEQIIRRAIEQALQENNGNQSAAAKQLGIGRSTLWRHLNNT